MTREHDPEWPEQAALVKRGVPPLVINALNEARDTLREGHHSTEHLRLLTLLAARSAQDEDLIDMWKCLARQRIELCEFIITCLVHPAAEPAEDIKTRRFLRSDDEGRVPHRELQLNEAIFYLADTRTAINTLIDLLIESDAWLDNNFYANGMFDQSAIESVTDAANKIAPHLKNLDKALGVVQKSFTDPKNDPTNADILIGARGGRPPHNVYIVYCVLLIMEWCKKAGIELPDWWPGKQKKHNNSSDIDHTPHLSARHFRGLLNTFYPFTKKQIEEGKEYDPGKIAELLAEIRRHVQSQLDPGKKR